MSRPPESDPPWFGPWCNWVRAGRPRGYRPKRAPHVIPRWAWDEYARRYPHHNPRPPKPPPTPPPVPEKPPKPAPSFVMDKPVVFTAWAPGEVRRDPRWYTAVIEVPGVAPLWRVEGTNKWIAQAESEDQIGVALGLLADKTGEKAIVATQGGWVHGNPDGSYASLVHRFQDVGINVVLAEAYVNDGGPTPDQIVWQAQHDGWEYAFPIVGVYHGYPLDAYNLAPYGMGFGEWTGETMQEADWQAHVRLIESAR